jgi:hypothetical protein
MALYDTKNDAYSLSSEGITPTGYANRGNITVDGVTRQYSENPSYNRGEGASVNADPLQAIFEKIGFNPYEMNPNTEALKQFNKDESTIFNETFAGSGITPNSLTPEALKYWNSEKARLIGEKIKELSDKRQAALMYFETLKEGWKDKNKVASWANIGGKEVALNVFGEIIPNPNVGQQMGQPTSPTAPPTAPPTPQQPMPVQQGQPQQTQPTATPSGALTRDVKPKDKTYEVVHTNEGYIGINKNDPNDKINYNVKKPLTAEQQQTLKQMVVINKLVKDIKEEFMDSDKGYGKNAYKDMTGIEGVTGWLRKRIGGTIPGAKYSEREAQFRAKVAQLYTIVYGFSGKQINEREIEKLKPFIPEVTDSDIEFAGKLRSVLQTSQDHINTTLEIAQKSGAALAGGEQVRIFEDKDPNSPTYGKRKRVYPDGREELF